MVESALVDRVMQSFGRCTTSKDFFDRFYAAFLASSPEIAVMFKNTDMGKQKQLLNASLNFVLMYAKNPDGAFTRDKLEQIGQIHDRSHVNVRPNMYPLWVESLLKTVKETEGSRFDAGLEQAWRKTLAPAIDLLKSKYEPAVGQPARPTSRV